MLVETCAFFLPPFLTEKRYSHADTAQHTRTSAMQLRVARGCGVAYGLRRCHICSNVHGTCECIHMNILRSLIKFLGFPTPPTPENQSLTPLNLLKSILIGSFLPQRKSFTH